MYKITNFFALLICGISVCFAARVKEPTWVSVPKKVYNPEKYLDTLILSERQRKLYLLLMPQSLLFPAKQE